MFEHLCNRVREYAQQRRLAELEKKSKGDPMEIGQLWNQQTSWVDEQEQQEEQEQESALNALGKGKGMQKGKGKERQESNA